MKPMHRSIAGLILSAMMIPVLIGLLACLPVPVGDPEKSRIDPEQSGMWLMVNEDEEPTITLFQPYDKRTWLISMYLIDSDEETCDWDDDIRVEGEDEDVHDYDFVVRYIEAHGPDCFEGEGPSVYKAWRTKLGGQWFMTWEYKGVYDKDRGFRAEYWYVWRIDKTSIDEFSLWMVNPEYDGFEDLEALEKLADAGDDYDLRTLNSARRAVERVIRINTKDVELYADDAMVFYRVRPAHLDLFVDALGDAMMDYRE